jgi:hypothetical protein
VYTGFSFLSLKYFFAGPGRACKMRARVGLRLYIAGSGFCGPGLACFAGLGSGLLA